MVDEAQQRGRKEARSVRSRPSYKQAIQHPFILLSASLSGCLPHCASVSFDWSARPNIVPFFLFRSLLLGQEGVGGALRGSESATSRPREVRRWVEVARRSTLHIAAAGRDRSGAKSRKARRQGERQRRLKRYRNTTHNSRTQRAARAARTRHSEGDTEGPQHRGEGCFAVGTLLSHRSVR